MKTILHTADSRGQADHGWLKVNHTFSFANYYDPERIRFGTLRVLNDDTIGPGEGFGTHPHDNMEIITIPLYGDLEHKDSMGNSGIITQGEIQVMSAGTGIEHSEFNANSDKEVKVLQIWIYPNQQNVKPRYDQLSFKDLEKENELFQIVSPNPDDEGSWIHQKAWFHMGNLKTGWSGKYNFKGNNHGVYVFVIEGNVSIENQDLQKRDGLGVYETNSINLEVKSDAHILIMEIPMDLN